METTDNSKYIFRNTKQCEAWYDKLNQEAKKYLYTVDKFIASFEPDTQIKLTSTVPESELPAFLKCVSFLIITCNLSRDFQFHDNFTRLQRYEPWPQFAQLNTSI